VLQARTRDFVFRAATDGVWGDLGSKKPVTSSVLRRNLQRDHLRRMTGLALGTGRGPADARSLARMHLRELAKKIETG